MAVGTAGRVRRGVAAGAGRVEDGCPAERPAVRRRRDVADEGDVDHAVAGGGVVGVARHGPSHKPPTQQDANNACVPALGRGYDRRFAVGVDLIETGAGLNVRSWVAFEI